MLRADDQFRMTGEDHRQRIGALEPAERSAGGTQRVHPLLQMQIDKLRHRFGVGLGGEFLAGRLQLRAQLGVVFDDTVVHDRDPRGRVRMRVVLGRRPVRGPSGMADAGRPGQRRAIEGGGEVAQFPLGAAAVDVAIDQRRDAGAVIAAVFQPAQAVQQQRRRRPRSDHANDAAHVSLASFCSRGTPRRIRVLSLAARARSPTRRRGRHR